MVDSELLLAIKQDLSNHYGDRLRTVILFGSEARGDADESSDVDLMIVLEGPVDTGLEIREITRLVYQLQIDREFFRPVQVVPVDENDYTSVNLGIYRNAKEDGIAL